MVGVQTSRNTSLSQFAAKKLTTARALVTYLFVWACLVKLPATGLQQWQHDSWEPVASYAAAHHLQWGRDIVFTYGPLGFLTTDYYWGHFFWPIVIWAGVFALIVAAALVPLLERTPRAIRLAIYVALPLLTVPTCLNLVFDSFRILSITVLAIACLPDERPGALRLVTTGLVLAVLSLTKFTYCVYSAWAFIIIAASNLQAVSKLQFACSRRRKEADYVENQNLSASLPRRLQFLKPAPGACWRNTAILGGSALFSLLGICLWSGQSIGNIFVHFMRSAQMAAGYSAAMALDPEGFDLPAGIVLLIFIVGLVLTSWLGSSNWRGRTNRVAIVAAGIFLIWKEGFVRADVHVILFFLHMFFLAALLPALLGIDWAQQVGRSVPTAPNPIDRMRSGAVVPQSRERPATSNNFGNALFARHLLTLTAICMLFSLAYLLFFNKHNKDFKAAIHNGLVARNRNTFNAYLRPATYKLELERYLETLRHEADLPEIRSRVGSNPVGAMNLDQEVAIFNGLNYVPHPIFENYAAYTPELQRLNSDFFNSQKAPEYLLWHTGSVDGRFPTQDDGEVLLRILNNYSPLMQEKGVLLWKRKSEGGNSYCLSNEQECSSSPEKWVPIPAEPTWLRIECKQTLPGILQGLLWRPSELRLEVQLDNREIRNYQLLPGNARNGFVISPFLRADYQLIEAARASREFPTDPTALPKTFRGEPRRIVAARVRPANEFAYKHSIRVVMQTIHGIWPIPGERPSTESNEISRAQ